MIVNLSEKELRDGAKEFELMFLLPKGNDGKKINIRLKINNNWMGWTIRNDVIRGVGLEIGNTIMTKVEPIFASGLIENYDDIVLFAEGNAARWIIENNITSGSTIDCCVRLAYFKIDTDSDVEDYYRVALVLEKCHNIVSLSSEEMIKDDDDDDKLSVEETLEKLFGSNKR